MSSLLLDTYFGKFDKDKKTISNSLYNIYREMKLDSVGRLPSLRNMYRFRNTSWPQNQIQLWPH